METIAPWEKQVTCDQPNLHATSARQRERRALEDTQQVLWDMTGFLQAVTIHTLKYFQLFSNASVTTFPSSVSTVISGNLSHRSTKVMSICYVTLPSKQIFQTPLPSLLFRVAYL